MAAQHKYLPEIWFSTHTPSLIGETVSLIGETVERLEVTGSDKAEDARLEGQVSMPSDYASELR